MATLQYCGLPPERDVVNAGIDAGGDVPVSGGGMRRDKRRHVVEVAVVLVVGQDERPFFSRPPGYSSECSTLRRYTTRRTRPSRDDRRNAQAADEPGNGRQLPGADVLAELVEHVALWACDTRRSICRHR